MGLGLYFAEGEGPKFQRPISSQADIENLSVILIFVSIVFTVPDTLKSPDTSKLEHIILLDTFKLASIFVSPSTDNLLDKMLINLKFEELDWGISVTSK